MNELQMAGRYRGHITASKVDRSRNGCIQFVARLSLASFLDHAGAWQPLDVPGGITAYLMLTTLRGEINIRQAEAIMDALSWDGNRLSDLHKTDWTGTELEAVVEHDTDDKGNARLVVSWLNPVGGLRPTAPEVLEGLDEEWTRIGASKGCPVA